jgi:hypothetical protein
MNAFDVRKRFMFFRKMLLSGFLMIYDKDVCHFLLNKEFINSYVTLSMIPIPQPKSSNSLFTLVIVQYLPLPNILKIS